MYLKEGVPEKVETCYCAAWIATNGTVVYGRRHHNCMYKMLARGLWPDKKLESQGFRTTEGRYVDRFEGYLLQEAAGIESKNTLLGGYFYFEGKGFLHSEDLYLDWNYERDVLGVENN